MWQVVQGILSHLGPELFDHLIRAGQGDPMDGEQLDECSPPELSEESPTVLKVTPSVHRAMLDQLVWDGREQGGLLVGPNDEPLITHFLIDEEAVTTAATFEVNGARMNGKLRPFLDLGMNCKGLVHSHPPGSTVPSVGDQKYVRRSLGNPRNQRAHEFFLPIICDGQLHPWVIRRDDPTNVRLAQLIVV
jgi:proteasome lid subunit RPN8/RPN11